VVLALRALSAGQREAVVLKFYLDLTDEQAAAAMRLSRAALRRHLAAARAALRGVLPPPSP
jgi:DNA-directed RNA polymerase specialized sigma24 family protein